MIAPSKAEQKTERSGGQKGRGLGGIFARPFFPIPIFPPPPNFVFRFAKCAAKEDVALAPALPCAGNDKELPNFVAF
jgi:hypothetical protein